MTAGAWTVQFVVFFSFAVLFRDENRAVYTKMKLL